MQKQTMIRIESLPLIKDAQTFFSTDKILSVDVLDITDAPNLTRLKAQIEGKAFMHSKRLFMPVLLKGSPENLFLKGKKGVPHNFMGHSALVFFDGDLESFLAQKKVYDLSAHYRKKNLVFDCENDFLIERYIAPFMPIDNTYRKQTSRFCFPGNILAQEL